MKNKSHPQVTFKWSRVDEGLLLSAFSVPKASHVYRKAKNYFLKRSEGQSLILFRGDQRPVIFVIEEDFEKVLDGLRIPK